MKKRFMRVIWMVLVLCLVLPSCAQASSLAERLREKLESYAEPVRHDFWYWLNDEDEGYAQWERVSGGVNFKIKLSNASLDHTVDAYTFEISAKNVYEEPIRLEASDGTYGDSLYYTGEKTFAPGKVGYSENFRLRADEKIRYIYVKLIKYHTEENTVYVEKGEQEELCWKIN